MKINKPLYYILNCTWGCIMTLIGAFVALALIITKHRPHKHAGCIYFNVGKNWGGMELGLFFLTDSNDSSITKNHEFGHSLQNCLWGPLFPFVVCIPSAIRYWLREFKTKKGKIIYSIILTTIVALTGISILVIGLILNVIPLIIISILILTYVLIILLWLLCKEIPLYNSISYVSYDSIWFEGQATNWGTQIAKSWTYQE